ncbi:hypothetical protein F5X96DRAFT_438645 [Biscogniauxia mediterranea]|nr:hypothetical protein F5X96DRAFT_438645 [Biscogniauxia mediterranea]
MARQRIPRWRISNLVYLVALASTASAISLESFQIITSNQIPSSCIRAYSTDIDNCARKDFTNGNQCSSGCVQGLQDTASRVIAACGTLNVDSKSLLGLTLSGDLIDTLCPGFEATTVTLTVRPSTTSPAQGFTTPSPVLITTSSTESTSEASTTLRTTTSIVQETTPQPVTSAITESLTRSTTTAQTTASTHTSANTSLETTTQPIETSTATQPQTSDDEPNQGQVPGSGGGSPFDFVPALGLGTTLQLRGWHMAFLLAMLLIPTV